MKTAHKKVIIVGAGFGGIELAKKLKHLPFDVWLLDKHNYHCFQPLLYQVATGGLEASSIAYPVRRIFRGYSNIECHMAAVQGINTDRRTLSTDIGEFEYDYLVIATGSTNNFFNFEPIKQQLFPLKSVVNALDIRSFIMQNLELAAITQDAAKRATLMNIAIIGGGPAGVEVAGALAEMKRYVFPKDFTNLDFSQMNIVLFEAAPRLLSAMSEHASAMSLRDIQRLGIQVQLNTMVEDYRADLIYLKGGGTFSTATVIWTAGVKGNPLAGLAADCIVGGNRIAVNDYNQVKGYDHIFAIGDVASQTDTENPKGLPMLAPVAVQQAHHLAKNLQRLEKNQDLQAFSYHNKGVMATIGKNKAVVDLPKVKFQGIFAWFVWMFVHILLLVGFRNKIITFFDWFINYINYDRPLGLIIRRFHKTYTEE